MEQIIDKQKCTGCHACMNICPKQAITMIEDEKGFKYPKIDPEKCINCGLCKKICPILKEKEAIKVNHKAYAAYNKNNEERKNSSSGGIFILLAKEIIKRNGVVFGATFDNNFEVVHDYAEAEEEIVKFMGSKYTQSTIGTTYKKVKEFLEQDRYVLFSGTPCQIGGLKSFLKKDYDKLYTQDIICHGVPSPLVWEKYKEYRKKIDKQLPEKINFRNKDNGWSEYNMKFEYNTKTYEKTHKKDIFMQAFLNNTSLRDSCYNCSFKTEYRDSDITLADFWGVKKICPDMYDDKGTSLVVVNSKKGEDLFNIIADNCIFQSIDLDEALKFNISYFKSVKADPKRRDFFSNLKGLNFDEVVKKYVSKQSLIRKIYTKISNYKNNN